MSSYQAPSKSLTLTVYCDECGTITSDTPTCVEAERIRAEHERKVHS